MNLKLNSHKLQGYMLFYSSLTLAIMAFSSQLSLAQLSSCEGYSIKSQSGRNSGLSLMPNVINVKGERVAETIAAGPWLKKPIYWGFYSVPSKPNTYRIYDFRKPESGFICLRTPSSRKNIPTPILHLNPKGEPLEWHFDTIHGRPNSYNVICASPGKWLGAKLIIGSIFSQTVATLDKNRTNVWEIKNLTHIFNQESPVEEILKSDDLIGDMRIRSTTGYSISIFEGTENGKKLNVTNGVDPMDFSVFTVRYEEGKGYTLSPKSDDWQMIRPSNDGVPNDCDYLKPDLPLRLFTKMEGGSHYWNIFKEEGSFLIQNTNSGLFISYDSKQQCLVQTTKDKATRYTVSQHSPPPPPKEYVSIPIPGTNEHMLSLNELPATTFGAARSMYGSGTEVLSDGSEWSVADKQKIEEIVAAFKANTDNCNCNPCDCNPFPVIGENLWFDFRRLAEVEYYGLLHDGTLSLAHEQLTLLDDPNSLTKGKVLLYRTITE